MLDVADASTIVIAGGDRQQQTLGTRPVCPSASSDHPDKRAVVRPGRGVGIPDCEHSLDHVGVRFGLGYPGGDAPGAVLIRALRKPREQREEPFGRLLGTLLQFARQLPCAASEAIPTPPHFFPRPAYIVGSL